RPDALKGYLLTPSGREVLARLASALRRETTSRAWSLTGPYGSGKSAFALFASQLLCGQGSASDAARSYLKQEDQALWKQLFRGARSLGEAALCPVLITGAREPLEVGLARGLEQSVRRFCRGK